MREQLHTLVDIKLRSEIKDLYDEFRNIRHEFNSRNLYASSMHIHAAIGVSLDTVDRFIKESVAIYKRVIQIDKNRFNDDFLEAESSEFFKFIGFELEKFDLALDQAVGGIAKSLSDSGLQDYVSYEAEKETSLQWMQTEIRLFHAEVLRDRLSLGTRLKKWYQESILGLILTCLIGLISIAAAVLRFFN